MSIAPLAPATRPVLEHAVHAGAPAVVAGDRTLSHADLAAVVAARAGAWGPDRRLVLVEGANTLDSLVAYLAALQHGHVALVVPAGRDAQTAAMVQAYDPDVVCRTTGDDVVRARTAHDLHPDLALLLSTSGTTGSPKLVRLSRDNVAANAAAIADYLGLRPDDRAITSLPLHYCYGLSVLHSHLVAGASVVLTDLSVVDECFWDLVTRTGATGLAGVPHTFDLLEASGFADRDLPTLRRVTQAGGRLAPESVRRWARVGRRDGWDLVVMYGATEATARMAWLPPGLAEKHPAAIGIAVPGGRLEIDEALDERAGVGELVYTGPNVMLGYAHGPQDLARGREVDALRTGDLARRVDGLVEVVGRLNRYGKVFGLRLDLDALEHLLREDVDPQARVVATDDCVHVFVEDARRATCAQGLVAAHCGVPPHAVRTHVVDPMPLTSTGKVDYAALRGLADHDADPAAVLTDAGLLADFALVLARPGAGPDDTFVTLGGDSLSYVELATRLATRFPDGLPPSWHTRPIGELESLATLVGDTTGNGAGSQGPASRSRGRRLVRLDTTVVLRAVAILFIVGSHVDVVTLEGGAHVLLALAGFSFARFQLAAPGGARGRLRHGAAAVARIVGPSVLWIGAVALLLGTYQPTTALLVRSFVNSSVWDRQWQFWFLEALVWITIAALALTCIPRLHALERRRPFRFALAVLAATAAIRFADVALTAGPTQRYTTLAVAFFFALGWAGASASTQRERVLVSALAALLVVGYFGEPRREAIVLVGFLLLLWVPHVVLPTRLARACGVLAGASLCIYLTHWQVYPWLEDNGLPWLGLGASIAVGIAYERLTRPWQRTLGKLVQGSR